MAKELNVKGQRREKFLLSTVENTFGCWKALGSKCVALNLISIVLVLNRQLYLFAKQQCSVLLLQAAYN